MPDFTIQHPINFLPSGDTTAEAIAKHIQEISNVYDGLNELLEVSGATAELLTQGVLTSVSQLPTTGNTTGDMYAIVGVNGYLLYVWDGTKWQNLTIASLQAATTEALGLVYLGTAAGAQSANPSATKVMTESELVAYFNNGATSAPLGTIIVWSDTVDTIPEGWVACDGSNGTPDLRSKFIRGSASDVASTGGDVFYQFTSSDLRSHMHNISLDIGALSHTHDAGALATNETTTTHTHDNPGTVAITTQGPSVADHLHLDSRNYVGKSPSYGLQRMGQFADTYVNALVEFRAGYLDGYHALPLGGNHGHTFTAVASSSEYTGQHKHAITNKQVSTASMDITSGATTTGAASEVVTKTIDNRPKYKEVIYIMRVGV